MGTGTLYGALVKHDEISIRYSTYLGANLEHAVLPEQHAATTGSHCVDVQLRALDGHTSRHSLEHMLERSTIPTNIGRCTTHIKADYGSFAIV